MARFVTQPFRHLIKRAEVLVLLSHIEIAGAAERIQPAERASVERRKPRPYTSAISASAGLAIMPSSRQRTTSLIIGIIIRAMISSSVKSRFG